MGRLFIFFLFVMQLYAGGVLSTKTYKWLTEVQVLMEKKEYNLALDSLSKLETVTKGRPYDMAFIHQTFGYIYLDMEKPGFAKRRFEQALAGDLLPTVQTLNILQNLAALQMQEEHYAKAADLLERWLELAEKKSAPIYITLAIARAQLDQNIRALKAAEKAIALAKTPREEWYKLLSALYYKTGDEAGMIRTLKTMVALFGPKKPYLDQLFALYMQREAYTDALAVQELAYQNGHVTTESEFLRLAMLYGYNGTPLAAAEVIIAGLEQKIVSENETNLKQVYEYLVTAREQTRAIGYLKKAAALSETGMLDLQLAQLLFDAEAYDEAAAAIKRALEKGGIKRPEEAYLLQGVAYYEANRMEEAKAVFKHLESFPSKAKTARSWIEYLENLG